MNKKIAGYLVIAVAVLVLAVFVFALFSYKGWEEHDCSGYAGGYEFFGSRTITFNEYWEPGQKKAEIELEIPVLSSPFFGGRIKIAKQRFIIIFKENHCPSAPVINVKINVCPQGGDKA